MIAIDKNVTNFTERKNGGHFESCYWAEEYTTSIEQLPIRDRK